MKLFVVLLLIVLSAPSQARTVLFQAFAEKTWGYSRTVAGPVVTSCGSEQIEEAKQLAEKLALEKCKRAGFRGRECALISSDLEENGKMTMEIEYQYGLSACGPRDIECRGLDTLGYRYGCIAGAFVKGKMEE